MFPATITQTLNMTVNVMMLMKSFSVILLYAFELV